LGLAHEVAADNDVVLDDGLAGEDDVRRAVEEGAAGDFVASVLVQRLVLWTRAMWSIGAYSLDVFAASGALWRHGGGQYSESC
jgi:hypothetical protein